MTEIQQGYIIGYIIGFTTGMVAYSLIMIMVT